MRTDDAFSAPSEGRRPVDEATLGRWRERVSQSVQPIWLHTEVGRRMAERLALIKRPAQTALIWEAAGGLGDEIIQTWPQTRRIRVNHGPELGIGVLPRRRRLGPAWLASRASTFARRGWVTSPNVLALALALALV